MSSLEETVEKQAETISQLADLMERNESRHRSLERTIRWMGVSVFILAIMLIVPVNQESLLRIVHATGSGSAESAANLSTAAVQVPAPAPQEKPMQCGQIGNANCDQVKEMVTQVVMGIFGQAMGQMGQLIKTTKVESMEGTLAGYSPEYLEFMKERIEGQIAELESKIGEKGVKARIAELKKIKAFGHKMTIMDHIANIDYDFDNLSSIQSVLASVVADMNNMSNKVTNMSTRMDTMAVDMHNMNTMAFDIHNMAATGVPVMGRMNNATSWMPW